MEKLIEEVRKFPVLYDQASDKYRNSEYKDNVWKNISITLEIKGGVKECKKKWSSVRDQLRRTLQKRKTTSGQAAVRHRKYKYEDVLQFLIPHIVDRDTLSNVPNFEEQEGEANEREDITDTQEESLNTTDVEPANVELEIETQNELQHKAAVPDNTSKFHVKKEKFSKLKRKTCREEQDSPASQLMAYILHEKEEENKKIKKTEEDGAKHPVDIFLCGISPILKSFSPILLNEAKSLIFSIVQECELKQLMRSKEDEDIRVPNTREPTYFQFDDN